MPYRSTEKQEGKVVIGADEAKDSVLAKAKEALADKITGNVVKEIYVPGRNCEPGCKIIK